MGSTPDRIDLKSKHPSAQHILLDPAGKRMDTAAFVCLISRAESESRDLVFLIGGADGIPPELRNAEADRPRATGAGGGGRGKAWRAC